MLVANWKISCRSHE